MSFVFIFAVILAAAFIATTVLFSHLTQQVVRLSLTGCPACWDSLVSF